MNTFFCAFGYWKNWRSYCFRCANPDSTTFFTTKPYSLPTKYNDVFFSFFRQEISGFQKTNGKWRNKNASFRVEFGHWSLCFDPVEKPHLLFNPFHRGFLTEFWNPQTKKVVTRRRVQKSLLPDQVAQERKDTRHLNTQTIKKQLLDGVQFFFPLERKDNSRLTFAYFF